MKPALRSTLHLKEKINAASLGRAIQDGISVCQQVCSLAGLSTPTFSSHPEHRLFFQAFLICISTYQPHCSPISFIMHPTAHRFLPQHHHPSCCVCFNEWQNAATRHDTFPCRLARQPDVPSGCTFVLHQVLGTRPAVYVTPGGEMKHGRTASYNLRRTECILDALDQLLAAFSE